MSLAVALTVIVPETVAPSAGDVSATVGAVLSTLDTVTETPAEIVLLPAASRARAFKVCVPLTIVVVSQERLYGLNVSSPPRATSSSKNWTPATPTLSAASAETVTVPDTLVPLAGAVRLTVGGVVSLFTATVIAADVVVLPAASRARAVTV